MRDPNKDRYLRAVRHEESAEIPFQEDEFEVSQVEKILGRPLHCSHVQRHVIETPPGASARGVSIP